MAGEAKTSKTVAWLMLLCNVWIPCNWRLLSHEEPKILFIYLELKWNKSARLFYQTKKIKLKPSLIAEEDNKGKKNHELFYSSKLFYSLLTCGSGDDKTMLHNNFYECRCNQLFENWPEP